MTITSPSCHTAATATPRSPAPPPGVAPLLLVTSGHVSLHNDGTPLEPAVAHCEPDAGGSGPLSLPCFSSIPFGGEGRSLSWCPTKWTHTPKAEAGIALSEQGPSPLHLSTLPYLSTQHGACGLPLHRSNDKGETRAEPSLSWF